MNDLDRALAPLDGARRAVVDAIAAEVSRREEVAAIVLATPTRGRFDPKSDLDFVVLVDQPWTQRVHLARDGVPVELFFKGELELERQIARGNPVVLGMLAFGRVVFDRRSRIESLVRLARERWVRGPDPLQGDADALARYHVHDLLDDAEDLLGAGEAARLVLAEARAACVHYLYAQRRRWWVKSKHVLADLATWDAEAAALVAASLRAATPAEEHDLLRQLARHATGTDASPAAWTSTRHDY